MLVVVLCGCGGFDFYEAIAFLYFSWLYLLIETKCWIRQEKIRVVLFDFGGEDRMICRYS